MNIKQTLDHELISRLNHEVQTLHATMYPEHFKAYDYDAVNQFFRSIMTNANFQFYVLEQAENVLGYIWFEIKEYNETAFKKAYRSIYIHQLNILKEYKGKGLGKRLMDKVEEIAGLNHIKKIELDYWSRNDQAKGFYEKNGYTQYRELVYKDL
ncbi:N-acetyltransferase family protein [Paenibacillus sp. Z3-2]